jgi:hypothetical protein
MPDFLSIINKIYNFDNYSTNLSTFKLIKRSSNTIPRERNTTFQYNIYKA